MEKQKFTKWLQKTIDHFNKDGSILTKVSFKESGKIFKKGQPLSIIIHKIKLKEVEDKKMLDQGKKRKASYEDKIITYHYDAGGWRRKPHDSGIEILGMSKEEGVINLSVDDIVRIMKEKEDIGIGNYEITEGEVPLIGAYKFILRRGGQGTFTVQVD